MPKINFLLISVIMNCHNGATYLKQSFKSLQNQKYNNWELIFFGTINLMMIVEKY